MNFLYPNFLYALPLVLVPLIIHLFNFRRYKKQPFTQVKFLEKATLVKKRFNRLKDFIILALRMLAIAALVIAFAHPLAPDATVQKDTQKFVSIYIDNSFSMAQEGNSGQLLDGAKQRAEEIADGFGDNAKFQLVTNNPEEVSKRFIEKDAFLEGLSKMSLSPMQWAKDQQVAFMRTSLSEQKGEQYLILLGDFQKSSYEGMANIEGDSVIQSYIIPLLGQQVANISIDSLWFEQANFSKGQTARLLAKLTNHGQEDVVARKITVEVNGLKRVLHSQDMAAQSSETVELFYAIESPGWKEVKVNVEDYPISFDNEYYTTYEVEADKKVLLLTEEGATANSNILKLYNRNPDFTCDHLSIGQLNIDQLASYDLLITDGLTNLSSGQGDAIFEYVANGGNWTFIPSMEEAAKDNFVWEKLGIGKSQVIKTKSQIATLELKHAFFDDVFDEVPENAIYPYLNAHWAARPTSRSPAIPLMSLVNGDPLVWLAEWKAGRVFLLTAGLSEANSNMVNNGLFVPVFYKFLNYKGSQLTYGFVIDDKASELIVGNRWTTDVVGLYKSDQFFIPKYTQKNGRVILFESEINEAGFYTMDEQPRAEQPYLHLGFNYDRKESNMSFWTEEELIAFSQESGISLIESGSYDHLAGYFTSINEKNNLWRVFLYLAFAFLLFEKVAIKLLFK